MIYYCLHSYIYLEGEILGLIVSFTIYFSAFFVMLFCGLKCFFQNGMQNKELYIIIFAGLLSLDISLMFLYPQITGVVGVKFPLRIVCSIALMGIVISSARLYRKESLKRVTIIATTLNLIAELVLSCFTNDVFVMEMNTSANVNMWVSMAFICLYLVIRITSLIYEHRRNLELYFVDLCIVLSFLMDMFTSGRMQFIAPYLTLLALIGGCDLLALGAFYVIKLMKNESGNEIDDSDKWFECLKEQYALSARERDVAELLYNRLSYKEISEELNISINTVKSHVGNIYSKTGTDSKEALRKLVDKERKNGV